ATECARTTRDAVTVIAPLANPQRHGNTFTTTTFGELRSSNDTVSVSVQPLLVCNGNGVCSVG
ncbi:MAG: hypothetical protein IPN94_25585, partial [Sphingobacteriales bacterium]|nr:hypothetical protein [Sphingobacteriales bacterium]